MQNRDGSFPTMPTAQPGVTSLCLMAFMSQGHLPGEGQYGDRLQLALDYIASCQKPNGILALAGARGKSISRAIDHQIGYTLVYNHAISALVLSESYAMVGMDRTKQDFRKDRPEDEGGWRYLGDIDNIDSDLSVTG